MAFWGGEGACGQGREMTVMADELSDFHLIEVVSVGLGWIAGGSGGITIQVAGVLGAYLKLGYFQRIVFTRP